MSLKLSLGELYLKTVDHQQGSLHGVIAAWQPEGSFGKLNRQLFYFNSTIVVFALLYLYYYQTINLLDSYNWHKIEFIFIRSILPFFYEIFRLKTSVVSSIYSKS